MAAGDLTTLGNVQDFLPQQTAAEDDILLSALITRASNLFRQKSNRDIQIPPATYSAEKHSGDGNFGIFTRQYPVTELLAANGVYIDGVLVPQAVNPGDEGWVLVDAEIGRIELVGQLFDVGVGNVSLTYKAGFTAIPQDLEQAIIDQVAYWYRGRDRIGISNQSIAGESVTYLGTWGSQQGGGGQTPLFLATVERYARCDA